jgi:HlyD family secretion protein
MNTIKNTVMNLVKNKKTRNWGIVAIVVLIIVAVAVPLLSAQKADAQANTEATVVSLNVGESVEASGSLSAQPFTNLNWKTGGVVEAVNIKTGDHVKAGDVLLTLKPSSASSSIVSAQADLVQAQKDLEDLLKSDTARAQAAKDLKDAQTAYNTAYDTRVRYNNKVWLTRTLIRYVGARAIYIVKYYRAYVDPDTIADADRDLALKKAELEDAQRAYDRLKDGPNTQDVAAQQAKVDSAQSTVDMLSIIAPFDGEVLSVDGQPGDVVSTGDLAVNLGDLNHLYTETQVDESDISKVKLGNPITATVDALPGVTLTGKVSSVNPVGETVSGLVKYTVRVDLDKPVTEATLPLGSTTNVVIQVKQATATLAVPITAIQNDSKGEYVWVIQSDGSTKRVDVVSGTIQGDLVTVTGDLHEGDRLSSTQGTTTKAPSGGLFGGG